MVSFYFHFCFFFWNSCGAFRTRPWPTGFGSDGRKLLPPLPPSPREITLGDRSHDILLPRPEILLSRFDVGALESGFQDHGGVAAVLVDIPGEGFPAAVIYSLIVTAQHRGTDPHAYLKDVLSRLPAMATKVALIPLLPIHWQPASAS